jgi:hypothetical protein
MKTAAAASSEMLMDPHKYIIYFSFQEEKNSNKSIII